MNDAWLWHKKLGHMSIDTLAKLARHDLVVGLPKLSFERDNICDACMKGKHLKSSFKSKNFISTSRPLELLYMDLCGPMSTPSPGGKQYNLVVVDDFTRFIWTYFLAHKNDASHI